MSIQEHDLLTEQFDERYSHSSLVTWDKPCINGPWGYYASYKIGAEWVDQQESIVVTTKRGMEHIDFLEMFMTCFCSDLAIESFSEIYTINFEQKPIFAPTLKSVISPLLVLHFLGVVSRIKTLKRGYVHHNENLKKVRGHIDILNNERKNLALKRYHRIFCNYDEYSVDIPENRLLKKALLFSQKLLNDIGENYSSIEKVNSILRKSLSLFEHVGGVVNLSNITFSRSHKIYKDYAEAIRLAKQILRHYDNSITNVRAQDEMVVPFVLDMSLLYEHYVYGLLKEAYEEKITYQFEGKTGYPDFLYKSEGFHAILDTKYIPKYDEGSLDTYVVRQLSGYSRDLKILRYLGYENMTEDSPIPCVPCVIIYPKENGTYDNPFLHNELEDLCTNGMRNLSRFYKIEIGVPTI